MEKICVTHSTSRRKSAATVVEIERSSQETNLFRCPRCNKVYQLYNSLRRHMRVECGQEPRHACPNCGRRFKHRFNLLEHLRHLACKKEKIMPVLNHKKIILDEVLMLKEER